MVSGVGETCFPHVIVLCRMASCFPKDEVEKSQDVEARSSAGKKAGAIGNGTIASEQPAAGMV